MNDRDKLRLHPALTREAQSVPTPAPQEPEYVEPEPVEAEHDGGPLEGEATEGSEDAEDQLEG